MICERCLTTYIQQSNAQRFCSGCAGEFRRERNHQSNAAKSERIRLAGHRIKGQRAQCEDCLIEILRRSHRHIVCGACRKRRKQDQDRRYAEPRRVELAAKSREWLDKNRDYAIGVKKEYYRKNAAALSEVAKDRYKHRTGAARRQSAREWYSKNREKVLARMNSEEGRCYSRENMRERMKEPSFRLHSNISRAIRTSIVTKSRRKWEALVGYTLEHLTSHLERQFLKGMSWSNMGEWHIDHIVPRKSFSFSGPDDPDFRACWALTNLRPLWATDNIRKHANRTHLI
jgi:hypothetical protein